MQGGTRDVASLPRHKLWLCGPSPTRLLHSNQPLYILCMVGFFDERLGPAMIFPRAWTCAERGRGFELKCCFVFWEGSSKRGVRAYSTQLIASYREL
jgi:hypothetical protein